MAESFSERFTLPVVDLSQNVSNLSEGLMDDFKSPADFFNKVGDPAMRSLTTGAVGAWLNPAFSAAENEYLGRWPLTWGGRPYPGQVEEARFRSFFKTTGAMAGVTLVNHLIDKTFFPDRPQGGTAASYFWDNVWTPIGAVVPIVPWRIKMPIMIGGHVLADLCDPPKK